LTFDAGTIIARMDLDDDEFDRKMRADVERIEAFERKEHEIRLTPRIDQHAEQEVRRSFERMDRQATADAHRRGGVFSMLGGLFGGGGGGRGGGPGILGGLAGAAGPGLNTGLASRLVSTRTALIAGGGGIGLGALPALAAPLLAGGVGAAGVGVAALGAHLLIGSKQKPGELYQPAQQAMKQIQKAFQQDAEPLVAPLKRAFREIPQLLHSLAPAFHQLFAGAATLIQPVLHGLHDLAIQVLPLLGKAFRAVAPLLQPLLGWLGQALGGILRGAIPLLHAAAPAVAAFGKVLATLGSGIGGLLRNMAPAIKASSIIFKGLGDLLGAIFPIVGKLASAFARNLAPVFTQLVGVVRQLLPFLRPIGDLFAKLAGAVLRDLVALLRPLAQLLVRIAPSFDTLAKALGQAFDVLENSGVFGVLAGALERMVGPLSKLVNDLVDKLAPYLPQIIQGFADFLNIMVTLAAAGLTGVVNALDWMVNNIPGLIPIILATVGAWKAYQVVSGIITGVKNAVKLLTAEETINKIKSVADITVKIAKVIWSTAVMVAQYAIQAAAATAAFIAENAATLGIIAGIALLIGAIIFLATHWKQVWHVIVTVAKDVWDFLTHGWGQFLIPGLYLIRKVVEFVRDHWKQAWDDITGVAKAFWHYIWDDFGAKILNFFTSTLPNAFRDAVKFIGQHWDDIKKIITAPVKFLVDNVLDGLIRVFDWITSKVGLGKPIREVHPFGLRTGGHIPGYGGGDRHLALLEGGEAVVSKETTRAHASELAAWGVPGFQQGGPVGGTSRLRSLERASHRSGGWLGDAANVATGFIGSVIHKAGDVAKITAAIFSGNMTALTNAITDMLGAKVSGAVGVMGQIVTALPKTLIHNIARYFIGQGAGSNSAIVKFAESFIGKVPYVWGGTTPQGWDCSGFVKYVYNHFGYQPPRTAAQQFGWVQRTGRPTPGGLAFFAGADGTAAVPGHVGIPISATHMVNAYTTGTNTIISPIRGSAGAISGYGVPPGGFRRALGAGSGNWTLGGLERLWMSAGGPARAAHIAAAIALAESGGNPRARNPSGASGLWQILGQVFPGNIFNPFINARNAVRKYYQAWGFSPWVTWTSGAYRQYMDNGGWLQPGVTLNNTRQPEAVLNPEQSAAFLRLAETAGRGGLEAKLERLIKAVEQNAAQTADGLAAVLNGSARKAIYSAAYQVR